MGFFVDDRGKTWRFRLTCHAVDHVREHVKDEQGVGIDLYDIRDEHFRMEDPSTLLYRLMNNPRLFLPVMHALLEIEQSCTFSDFTKAIGGDGLENAGEAFLNELIDFFPRRRRETLRHLLEGQKKVRDAHEARVREVNDKLMEEWKENWESPQAMDEVLQFMRLELGKRFGV